MLRDYGQNAAGVNRDDSAAGITEHDRGGTDTVNIGEVWGAGGFHEPHSTTDPAKCQELEEKIPRFFSGAFPLGAMTESEG